MFAIGGKYLFNGKGFFQLVGALAFVLFSETAGVKIPRSSGFLGSLQKAGLRTESKKKVGRPTGRLPDLQPMLQSEFKSPAERPGGLTPSFI